MNASPARERRPVPPGRARRPHGDREQGSVLVAVLVLLTAAVAVSAAVIGDASILAADLRARRDVLCARYAALGGLALGVPAEEAASLVDERVDSLTSFRVRLSATWCVLRATGRCGAAVRTLDRTLADPAECSAAPP